VTPSRRQVLRAAAAGATLVSLPGFLAGCGPKVALSTPTLGANAHFALFGVDAQGLAGVMAELVSSGADAADLYFQYTRTNAATLEDGVVSSASTTVDQGVGLRVVVGDQTGYAYTEDLSVEAMKGAARVAASIARGKAALPPQAFTPVGQPASRYTLALPWSEVQLPQRLERMERLAALAKAQDPAVEKVVVSWSDSEERVLIATLDGRLLEDLRPMSRVWCQVTARRAAASTGTPTQTWRPWRSRRSTAPWCSSTPAARPPGRCRWCWRRGPAASCCTRRWATAWRPTSTARMSPFTQT